LQNTHELKSVHLGHDEIEQNRVGRARGQAFDGLTRVVCDIDLITAPAEQNANLLAEIEIIVDDENLGLGRPVEITAENRCELLGIDGLGEEAGGRSGKCVGRGNS
jgi:hypothetical protein